MFTDIESSTRLLRTLGDDYAVVLDRHRRLLRSAWSARNGYVVDSSGDEFFVAFANRSEAIAACADGQLALAGDPWPGGARVRVRMGIHTGIAAPRAGRYVAMAVHQAARVAVAAHGGQVLVSETAVPRADPAALTWAGDRLDLVSLGRFRVRDFDGPVQLFQIAGESLDASFPAVRALPAVRHNLVRPTTAILGRRNDLTRLADALDRARLVTVVGTGGVGKTRLVTELGVGSTDRWPGGVWLVDCSTVDSAEGTVALSHRT